MVLVCNTGEKEEDCRKYLCMLANRHVDGIILVGSIFNRLCDEETLNLLSDIPIVMANGKIDRTISMQFWLMKHTEWNLPPNIYMKEDAENLLM